MSSHDQSSTPSTDPKVVAEMLPFAIYAIVPIVITIIIAYTLGSIN